MAKDKFKQMQQGGGALSSFQDMVQQAATVAAIEKQAEQPKESVSATVSSQGDTPRYTPDTPPVHPPIHPGDTPKIEQRFMRLPNPQIPVAECNLVTRYCEQFTNMTRQDFVELAIIEKLHKESLMPDGDFNARFDEIRNRPPRGHRKNTKTK